MDSLFVSTSELRVAHVSRISFRLFFDLRSLFVHVWSRALSTCFLSLPPFVLSLRNQRQCLAPLTRIPPSFDVRLRLSCLRPVPALDTPVTPKRMLLRVVSDREHEGGAAAGRISHPC